LILSVLLVSLYSINASFERDYTVHLQRDGVPPNSGWTILRAADPHQQVQFTISLQLQNLEKLEDLFWAISDPFNPLYTQYLTRSEVKELVAPPIRVQKDILRWIQEIEQTLPSGNLISVENRQTTIVVRSTCLFAEKLFQTDMFLFHNSRNNIVVAKHLGTLSLPTELSDSINLITGITELPPIKERLSKKSSSVSSSSSTSTTGPAPPPQPNNECNNPFTIKQLYNVPLDLFITNKLSNASIYAEEDDAPEGFGLGSIEDYQHSLGLPSNPITCILGNAASDYALNDTDTEANLDTEMVTGMAPNATTCFYIMSIYNGWMYEFSEQIINTPKAPLVVSMSYGWNENQACDNISQGAGLGNCTYYHIPNSQVYVNMTNTNFQMLGVIGHTILASSGDGGTAGNQGTTNNCETMGPLFPAGSPFLTSVGGTSVEASNQPPRGWDASAPPICTDAFYQCNCSTSNNEQPALSNNTAGFDTGGGFSIYSSQPSYQMAAVQGYLKSGVELPSSQYWNPKNRGYPDVAGVAGNVCLLDPGSPCNMVAGTSCSAPMWAGLMTLLNNDRLNAGKKPLGFFNPVIYNMFAANPSLYYNNQFAGGNNNGGCPPNMGFNYKAGFWTPLTGCGSPNFGEIRKYVAQLN